MSFRIECDVCKEPVAMVGGTNMMRWPSEEPIYCQECWEKPLDTGGQPYCGHCLMEKQKMVLVTHCEEHNLDN